MKKYLNILLIFALVLLIEIFGDYYIGPNYRGNLMPVEPLSLEDIQLNLGSYIAFSAILTVIIYFLAKDKNKKR